jgi:hypothetical protein
MRADHHASLLSDWITSAFCESTPKLGLTRSQRAELDLLL